MPPKKPDPASSVRRCRNGLGLNYNVRRPGPDGRVVEVSEFAEFGEALPSNLDPVEAMRLDCLGVISEPGASVADLEAEAAARLSAYRAARSGVAGYI